MGRAHLGQSPRDQGVVDVSAVPGQQKIHLVHARKRNVSRIPGGSRRDQASGEDDAGGWLENGSTQKTGQPIAWFADLLLGVDDREVNANQ